MAQSWEVFLASHGYSVDEFDAFDERMQGLLTDLYRLEEERRRQDEAMRRLEEERRRQDEAKHGTYFSLISEVWPTPRNCLLGDWNTSEQLLRRSKAPDFEKAHLPGDRRNHQEHVEARRLAVQINTGVGDSVSTANDRLFPVDIFGMSFSSAQKAHLLPKSRGDATTWGSIGLLVLGIAPHSQPKMSVVEKKAVIGGRLNNSNVVGIRNMISNLIRMDNQMHCFDNYPSVLILPILSVNGAKSWKGDGYQALVLCSEPSVAKSILMISVDPSPTTEATLDEINTAVDLASSLCEFLALTAKKSGRKIVCSYQKSATEKASASTYLNTYSNNTVPVPPRLRVPPPKPVCKVTFSSHSEAFVSNSHPAPDPLLLGFKSCNNWCRRQLGFRMVAAAEPEDLDELSEEGQLMLEEYIKQTQKEMQEEQENEILRLFGEEGVKITD